MWLFNVLAAFQRELIIGAAAGVLFGFVMRIAWASIASAPRDPIARRIMAELDDPATFVQSGIAFGLFTGAHMVLDAITTRRVPLSTEESLLVYLMFVGGAFALAKMIGAAAKRLARRLIDVEERQRPAE